MFCIGLATWGSRLAANSTYTKYPPDIQEVLLLAFNVLPIMDKLPARVVWSMTATKSTVEHARNICDRLDR